MPDDVAKVVAGLSEAQREVVQHAWPYPDRHRQGAQVSYCPVWRGERNRVALQRKGLIAPYSSGGPRLTPLGLAVRAHLEGEAS